jgi:hypothetical protein
MASKTYWLAASAWTLVGGVAGLAGGYAPFKSWCELCGSHGCRRKHPRWCPFRRGGKR